MWIQDGFYAQDVIVISEDPLVTTTGAGVKVATSDTQSGAVAIAAKIVSLSGTMIEDGNGQTITEPTFTIEGIADYPVKPLATIEIGGPAMTPPVSPDTTGMLVSITGVCPYSTYDPSWGVYGAYVFYIDDGSGAIDGRELNECGNPVPGLRVLVDASDFEFMPPEVSQYRTVEGVAAYETATLPDMSTTIVRQIFYPVVTEPGPPFTVYPVDSSDITWTSAAVTWQTDVEATSQVAYDTVSWYSFDCYANRTTLDEDLEFSHAVSLTGLTEGTTYYFRVRSTASGNTVTSDEFSFTTSAQGIVIGNVSVTSITETGARISWETRDSETNGLLDTDGFVRYGPCPNWGDHTATDVYRASHYVDLTGLTFGTTYCYKIFATKDGYPGASTTTFIFDTPKRPITISDVHIEGVTETQATIEWTTDVEASSEVAYGLTSGYGGLATGTDGTSHSVTLSGLTPNSLYYFRARSADGPQYIPAEQPGTFRTLTTVVYRNVDVTSVAQTTARIEWDTYYWYSWYGYPPWLVSLESTSQVEYAPTAIWDSGPHVSTTISDVEDPRVHHFVDLHELTQDTQYTYRVLSTVEDQDGVPSDTYTFTTRGPCVDYPTIGAAKAATLDTHCVNITGPAVITKVVGHLEILGDPPTEVWVQECYYAQDLGPGGRLMAGVKIVTSDAQAGSVVPGARITSLSGDMTDDVGGQAIHDPSVTIDGTASTNPYVMRQDTIMGPHLGQGLDTTSMMVRFFGKCLLSGFDPDWGGGNGAYIFYIDDGSGVIDGRDLDESGNPYRGIRILIDAPDPYFLGVLVGDYVMVEGIASYEHAVRLLPEPPVDLGNVRHILYPTVYPLNAAW